MALLSLTGGDEAARIGFVSETAKVESSADEIEEPEASQSAD